MTSARFATAIRFARFVTVGGLASAVYLSLTALLVLTGLHYLVAATLAYACAIVTNFLVNRQWTFSRGTKRIHNQALSFLTVQLSVGALNLSLLHLLMLTDLAVVVVCQLAAAAVLLPVNFLASRRWGFR